MLDYESLFIKNIKIAMAINEGRTDMRSTTKCVAIYMYKKKIVEIGMNKSKTHPMLLKFKYDYFKYFSTENISTMSRKSKRPQYPIHAEFDGYIKLLNSGVDFDTLFIYRGDNCTLACEPCYVCAKWIRRINRLKVGYVNVNGNFEIVNSEDVIGHHRRGFQSYKEYMPFKDHCCNDEDM